MRCIWADEKEPLYVKYHDEEWGRPTFQDEQLFEMLCLEGAQAGLSWITILKKRENYRELFDQFDAKVMAAYDAHKVEQLKNDPRIIRNRLKINAFIENAKAYLKVKQQYESFAQYIWSFVDGKPVQNEWRTHEEMPAQTPISVQMSMQLKKDGFKFVGPTILVSVLFDSAFDLSFICSCIFMY